MELVLELPPYMKLMKGLKFMPNDQILVENYLYNKLRGMAYFRDVVFDCDLYGAAEPWQIWEAFKGVDGQDLYFFTQLKRSINKSGQLSSHVNRKVGSAGGTWSAENSLTPVFATHNNDQIIGYCRRLRYENPQMPEHHGEWIMHEYSLHESYIQDDWPCPNYVLCRIRKNERVKRKAEKVKRVMMMSNERSNKRAKNICSFEPEIMSTTDQGDVANFSVTSNDFEDWDYETTINHCTTTGDHVCGFNEMLKDFESWCYETNLDQSTQGITSDQLLHEIATANWSTTGILSN